MSSEGNQWSAAFAGARTEGMLVYDRIIARLFTPWAEDLVDRLDPAPGATALDVACGPGTVTHLLARRVGPGGKVIATDISPAMLEIGRSRQFEGAAIEWVESPAAPLPVPDASVDVVTCQQGLQFFPEKTAALAEMRRALRSGGRAGVAVWTAIEDQQFFGALHRAIAKAVSPELAARYLGPFLLSGDAAAEHARAAGFESVSCERVTLPGILEGGAKALVETLAAAGIAADIAALDTGRRGALLREVERLVAPLERDGALHGTLTASVLLLS